MSTQLKPERQISPLTISRFLATLLLMVLLTEAGALEAGVLTEDGCIPVDRPSATLLLPYFEVDLSDEESRDTLLTVQNVSFAPILTRVTVWTDLTFPTLSFDWFLDSKGAGSLNLRHLLAGNLPITGGSAPSSCSNPLLLPELDEEDLTRLQARHLGMPDPTDGLCYASKRGETDLAVGYVTIDVIQGCDASITDPTHSDYFGADDSGLAGSENALVGDFFLVDRKADSAQSGSLAHIPADPEYAVTGGLTFYGSISGAFGSDGRMPLSSRWQTHYLDGGLFGGGTDLLLWTGPFSVRSPEDCEFIGGPEPFGPFFFAETRTEGGLPETFDVFQIPANAARLTIGEDIQMDSPFGILEFDASFQCGVCSPPFAGYAQVYMTPIVSAEGGFSAMRRAIPLNDLCFQ